MSGASEPKRVIVNADDLGFSPGVTEGILRAHREGIVTSTTVAANMPGAEQAVRRLVDTPELGVGVHLNVSQGPVLSKEGRALADADGVMRRSGLGVVRACLFHPRLLAAVEGECEAQIRWVLDHGIHPTHIDSHRHLHAFPPVFVRVVALARRYDIGLVRRARERLHGRGWPAARLGGRCKRLALNLCSGVDHGLRGRVHGTVGTWGIAHTGRIDARWLIQAARCVRPGVTEIMTHPALSDDLDPEMTYLGESRRVELDALCDPEVKEAFQKQDVELIHYGQIP